MFLNKGVKTKLLLTNQYVTMINVQSETLHILWRLPNLLVSVMKLLVYMCY